MSKRIVVGLSGATGMIYGIRLLELLSHTSYETHLIVTATGKTNIGLETDYSAQQVIAMADFSYNDTDMTAAISSGSFLTEGMIVAPCTIKSLSGIANAYTSNLLVRAADVCLKEKRKLVLMVRETPLHKGHLQLMTRAAELGAHILPPMPSFYHRPTTIEEIVDQTIGKIFDYLGIKHDLFTRWGSFAPP